MCEGVRPRVSVPVFFCVFYNFDYLLNYDIILLFLLCMYVFGGEVYIDA